MVLVEDYHRRAKIDLPQAKLHAAIHAVVERQLAEQLPAAVNALQRLLAEGLERHDAIHAIGSVLGEHMRQLMIGALDAENPNASYFGALDQLSVSSWRREFGVDDHAV